MKEGPMLTSAQFREVTHYIASGWSWGALAKLLRHKWDMLFTAGELQNAYRAAQYAYAQEEKQRAKPEYYAAILED